MTNQEQYKRLLDYEVNPPSTIWSAIENDLEQLPPIEFQERLINYTEAPPVQLWNKIDQVLSDQDTKTRIVSFNKNWFRYAAAAAILVIVAVGISMFVTNDSDTDLAKHTERHPTKTQSPIKFEQENSNSNSASTTNTSASEVPDNQYAEKKQNAELGKSPKNPTKRYLTFAKENGQTVRLSKKVFPVFDCADKATASIQKRCKENIESLQQKMANSLTSPTTDFAGLIDMIKTLEEND